MRSILLKVGLLVAVGLGLGGSTTQLCSRTIWVEPGGSIQAQIDAAPPGSVVRLPEGTWKESIFINKPLTLRGQGPELSVIQAKSEVAPVLWVSGLLADMPITVVVEGLTLLGRTTIVGSDGIEREAVANLGVLANGMAQVTVQNCVILETRKGILLSDATQALITNATIRSDGTTGIELRGRAQAMVLKTAVIGGGLGVMVEENGQAAILDSTIEDAYAGIYARSNAQLAITGTRIARSRSVGIVLSGQAQARIATCVIVGNQAHGVVLGQRASAVLTDNVIAENGMYGVLVTLHDPCLPRSPYSWFSGFVSGANNAIPAPEDPDGNLLGAVCPEEISFLMTKEGGVYPHR